jgi:hypothetical protein
MDVTTKLDADIHGAMMFRLMFGTQDDHYESESAAALLRGLKGLDDESARVTITLWAMDADTGRYPN